MTTNTMQAPAASASLVAIAGGVPAMGGQLPAGISSLSETYGDWVIACQTVNEATICIMRQSQSHTQTGQHVLTVEFQQDEKGNLLGALLMPFGLGLKHGVILKVDDEEEALPLNFVTCLPTGCVVPLPADKALIARLEAGSILHLIAEAHFDAQPVSFSVSLNGFAAALNRVGKLMK